MVGYLDPKAGKIKYSVFQLSKDTLKLLKPYKWEFLATSLIRLIGDLAYLYPFYAIAVVVNFLTVYKNGESLKQLWVYLTFYIIAMTVRAVSQFYSKRHGYSLAYKVATDSELLGIRHMFHLDMEWHEKENSGNKIKKIQNASDGFGNVISTWFASIIEIIANLVAINFILYQFDSTVTLSLITYFFVYLLVSMFLSRKANYAGYIYKQGQEELNGIMFESINNVRTVKVMSMIDSLYNHIKQSTENLVIKYKIRNIWYRTRDLSSDAMSLLFLVSMVMFISIRITDGVYEVGFLVLFLSYYDELKGSINELANAELELTASRFSISRMKDVLNEPITIDNENGKISFPRDWKKIEVKNLSFAYGENKVLNDISFEINRGEKIGIVGLSGSGKSTLFKLLLKERESTDGTIFFDNIPIQKLSKRDYFKNVSVVLQDTEVFNFSLKENITITNTNAENDKNLLDQSIETAHINELVSKLPQGVDTLIGEKGVKLSGGERQRLGIARAVFKEPQVLFLDEATSHLDIESEEKIKDSLHKFFEKVTAVVIAHRLTTVKEMDKIIVLEYGKVIESGSFDELYSKKGRFFELWEKQKI